MSFSKFGLSDAVLQGVKASGYHTPTKIQSETIPLVMSGRDIIGCAPTGTGKTAAFVLPILHQLADVHPASQHHRAPRVLVLSPTRELTNQIKEAVATYGSFTKISSVAVFGGVSINNQVAAIQKGTDIVVATPGRLLDLVNRRSINLSHIQVLVLDEADRMYDMGFIKDVRKIIALIPRKRQTLLFSATMPDEIRKIVAEIQHDPAYVEIGRHSTPTVTVVQEFYKIARQAKPDLLVSVLKHESVNIALVFSRTKHGADRIARKLAQSGLSACVLHSNRTQAQRQQALDGFKQGRFKILVATDIAARGIDVDGISHVVNYDTPVFAEDYVHRIGRTGRAESTGTAMTFVSSEEITYLRRIEKLTGAKAELKSYPGYESSIEVEKPVAPVTQAASRYTRKYFRTPRFA